MNGKMMHNPITLLRQGRLETLIPAGKALIFAVLIVVEVVVFASNFDTMISYGVWITLAAEIALAVENAVKIWGLRSFKHKIVCYVLDTLLLLVITYFTDGALISTMYVVILTEFYLSQKKLSGSIAMGACSIVLFLATFAISSAFRSGELNIWASVSSAFNDLIVLILHFLIVNFTLQVYRKNLEIAQAIEELNESNQKLNESNEKLRAANLELQTVTLLEERQRIAKEIHDTAGHSITTVIMQTEAARLVLDSDPEDAKRKLAAAVS